jgi:transcriptional regulator with XRE-family HTH domain
MSIITLQNTPHEALVALASFVKTVRLDREMTLEELASRTGVSRSSLIRLEKNGAGSTETQVRIFAALGVLDVLVSAFEPPEKQVTVAQLKKMSTTRQRQRGRRRKHDIS